MVKEYIAPFRVYEYPFELIMKVNNLFGKLNKKGI